LTALNEKEVRLDYIRGMIETMIGMQEMKVYPPIVIPDNTIITSGKIRNLDNPKDEGALLDMQAKAQLESIKQMSKLE